LTTFERRKRLLELLHKEPRLRVPEIADTLGVSQGTVRNDLNALAEEKSIIRVRGGAVIPADNTLTNSSTFATRASANEEAKNSIGREAASLVEDGDAILLDASSTVYHMGAFLASRNKLRVVTNGIEIARLLALNPTNMVILIGGIMRHGTESVIGPWSERFLENMCTKTAFISCSGFTPEAGMSEIDMYESQFRKTAISCTNRVVGLIDSSKFGKVDLTPSVHTSQISLVLTDDNLSKEWEARLKESGVDYRICSHE
jgi:DeoR/GlpR family transcriptional regulator of sugar metabolism